MNLNPSQFPRRSFKWCDRLEFNVILFSVVWMIRKNVKDYRILQYIEDLIFI